MQWTYSAEATQWCRAAHVLSLSLRLSSQEETAVAVWPQSCHVVRKAGQDGTVWVVGWEQLEEGCAEPWTRHSHPTHSGLAKSGPLYLDRDPLRTADKAWCERLLAERLVNQLIPYVVQRWSHDPLYNPLLSYFILSTIRIYPMRVFKYVQNSRVKCVRTIMELPTSLRIT